MKTTCQWKLEPVSDQSSRYVLDLQTSLTFDMVMRLFWSAITVQVRYRSSGTKEENVEHQLTAIANKTKRSSRDREVRAEFFSRSQGVCSCLEPSGIIFNRNHNGLFVKVDGGLWRRMVHGRRSPSASARRRCWRLKSSRSARASASLKIKVPSGK